MYQPNYRPKSKVIEAYQNSLDRKHKQATIETKIDELQEIQQVVKQETEAHNIWKKIQAERQNRTATLLEVEDNEELEAASTSPPATPTPPKILNYKLIGINKVEQLNYFKKLLDPSLKQRWHNSSKPIKLRGILAEVNQQKIALILADISAEERVAKIISLIILPEYPHHQIRDKLIECLRQSLPKIDCDRLELNP